MVKKKEQSKKRPSPNGGNGTPKRDERGRFLPGNPGGPGNPHGCQVAQLRAVLLSAISPEDIQAAVKCLVEKARDGNLMAIRELFDRAVGRASQKIEPEENYNGMSDEEVIDAVVEDLRERGYRVTPPKEKRAR